jgi:hypothetical protein
VARVGWITTCVCGKRGLGSQNVKAVRGGDHCDALVVVERGAGEGAELVVSVRATACGYMEAAAGV